MDQSLIAQKLRELADLFEEATKPKAVKEEAPKAVKASKPEKQLELELPTEPETTLDDLRQGMAELIGSGKRDKVLAILAKLEVKKVSDIPEDKFSEAMSLINGSR